MCIPHTYVLQCTEYEYEITHMTYSPFHKTLPSSILEMHWISARFFEMGDKMSNVYNVQCIHTKSKYAVYSLYSTLNTVNCTVFSVQPTFSTNIKITSLSVRFAPLIITPCAPCTLQTYARRVSQQGCK